VTAERGGGPARSGAVDYRGHFEIHHLEAGDWHLRARLDGGTRQAEAWVAIAADDREVVRDLELGNGLVLDGLVLFESRPLPDAQLAVRGLDLTLERGVTTDHRGTFRVEDLEAGRYLVEVVHSERMLSQSQELELTTDREIVIEIVPGVLTGTVVDAETGEGVVDALVYLQRFLGGTEPGPLTTVGTDADGSFVTATLAPGRYRLTVRADGYAPAERRLDVVAGVAAEPVTIEIEPTVGLRLTVRRSEGPPPIRATVVVFGQDGRSVHAEEALLSAYGYGYLRQVPPGSWTLLIKAPGSAAAIARVTVPGDPLEVTLPPGAPLTVRVPALLESNAAAVLTVTAADGTRHLGVDPGGTLRQSWPLTGGKATVPDLPAGSWLLEVTAVDGRLWTASAVTAGDAAAIVEIE